ncbi:MAG: sugar phosphate isomerase/epimerase [Planctomycetes bacterium]|nr:sugar phosphate isomerase/epimerase [Planctomycetota bacterium]MCH9725644.1 sugar phosphate isomerase/epimerase [Planctomycetota bacterium]MCH9777698.1 sugar phosphate isomerase/epimerase [Planctomycetota bacterium]MCH9792514.1 sugar phosphate isomerase/epimerase [Planctomycetota bacterium]MDF1742197.1 sugar phosphate isomerase/epimerase [Gimesia sp.]
MPKLAAFPKAFMDELCLSGEMTLRQWIDLAATLDIDGLEFYAGFLEMKNENFWPEAKKMASDHGLEIPMMCCSPDFTHPDESFRKEQIEHEKFWMEMTAALGGKYCRVLSGQRRPEVSREEGIQYAVSSIEACLPLAEKLGITLTIENHYKDNYWDYPEFAQMADVFCDLVSRIDSPHFGVNYDPSNTILAGEDPLDLLARVKNRVLTMHASDRYLIEGTIEDLRKEENSLGYASRLSHGVIGKGLNDYDTIFSQLKEVGFDSWISIEDGVNGMEELHESVLFLRTKMHQYWE